MNALAIHLYLTITFINLVIIRLAQNYRIIVNKLAFCLSKKRVYSEVYLCQASMS